MTKSVAIIETGRPMSGGRGGGSVNSMLLLAAFYRDRGYKVALIFRHRTHFEPAIGPKGAEVFYLGGKCKSSALQSRRKKGLIKRIPIRLREAVSCLRKGPELLKVVRILLSLEGLQAVHLNNRLLPNTHLLLIKLFLPVRLYQHQRQYDEFLILPRFFYEKLLDRVISVSDHVTEGVTKLGIKNVQTVYNSCIEYKGGVEYSTPVEKVRFLWVGRMVPWKGLHEVPRLLTGLECIVDIYGTGEVGEQYSESVFEQFKNMGVRYTHHGFVPSAEIFGRKYCDTFLLHTSITAEPFGRVIVEAMSIGMIPFTFGMGGAHELVADGEDGVVIEQNTPVSELFTVQSHDWQQIGLTAKKSFEQRFSKNVHYKNLGEILCVE